MNRFVIRRLVSALCSTGLFVISSQVMASAFQLWEQDGASVGNYHAGYAAKAEDASTAFYNPAGLTRFKNQQAIFAASGIMPDFKYSGNITVSSINGGLTPLTVTAQGGTFGLVPALQYVAPLSDWASFGFSVVVPFGLKTNYGNSTPLRYVATQTAVSVVDISPELAFKVTDKASIGFGPDLQIMHGEFDQVGTLAGELDTYSTNKADDTAYGYHLGALYEFTPDARVGVSYHSQVAHHLTGTSHFTGPLATIINGGPLYSPNASVNIKLPAYTALSGYYRVVPKVAVMGSVIYTQWNHIQTLILKNIAAIDVPGLFPSTHVEVVMPQHYRNTWNYALGADFYATDCFTFRTGIGYDQTPLTNRYRHVQLPDANRFAVALGSHFKATQTIGLDVSWLHVFAQRVLVNPPAQVNGAQTTTTDGHVTGGADVIAGQLTWDFV